LAWLRCLCQKAVNLSSNHCWSRFAILWPRILVNRLPNRLVVLLIGDCAEQLTAHEIRLMLRDRLKTVIFVLHKYRYTIKRAIHGPE
jgi:indolepyruvate decarboxylase